MSDLPIDADLVARVGSRDPIAVQTIRSGFGRLDRPGQRVVLDALAAHAAEHDPDALELLLQLIDDHALDRGALRKLIIDDDEVDDAHQDVLIAVARSIGNFRGDAAFTTWLHTVARNTAVAQLRRRREADRLHTDIDISNAARLSSMIATRDQLREAVGELPDHYREVLVRRDIDRRSYADIAADLGLELNTVKSRLSRARALVARSSHFEPLTDHG